MPPLPKQLDLRQLRRDIRIEDGRFVISVDGVDVELRVGGYQASWELYYALWSEPSPRLLCYHPTLHAFHPYSPICVQQGDITLVGSLGSLSSSFMTHAIW